MRLMDFLERLRDVAGFLTIIPVKKTDKATLINTADNMYLFPLLGGFIGLLAGGFGWCLLNLLPSIVIGALTIGFILIFSGFHHTDGLLDFGDGLMVQGKPKEKISAMKDNRLGSGGFTLTLIIILLSIFSVSSIPQTILLQSLIVSEVSAKLSMVVLARIGRSAHEGSGKYFVDVLHRQHWQLRLTAAVGISVILTIFLLGIIGVAVLTSGVVTSFVMLGIANRNFNGITGDIFGATNEISRMAALLTVLMVIR